MDIDNFEYHLPKRLIANSPASPRDHSRLLVVNRKNRQTTHHKFYDIEKYLSPNDVLVLNKTKVFPARFFAIKDTGGKVEILLLENINYNVWKALTKPGLKENQTISFNGTQFRIVGHQEQTVLLKPAINKSKLLDLLDKHGKTPLPPYINSTHSESSLRQKYQTVFAEKSGSVAAPTAGFHFTEALLTKLKRKGIQIEYLTLHVGLGTFAPVKTKQLEDHPMHYESYEVDKDTALKLNKAKLSGKRIVAVGTTTTRVLETIAGNDSKLDMANLKGKTNLFIYPPYKYKFVDALITNFHIPASTLLALVSAFVSYPNTVEKFKDFNSTLIGKAYKTAIKVGYRFYSFGDACLIF